MAQRAVALKCTISFVALKVHKSDHEMKGMELRAPTAVMTKLVQNVCVCVMRCIRSYERFINPPAPSDVAGAESQGREPERLR